MNVRARVRAFAVVALAAMVVISPHVEAHAQTVKMSARSYQRLKAMIAKAKDINRHHYHYLWGGGHNASFSGPYDCSGAVSAVLHAGGYLGSPEVSGQMETFGQPGKGLVTIYANKTHVYMCILGYYFGTSSANPGGGAGWFRGSARAGFVVRHAPLP
jgi:hypothetical protein